MCPPDFYGIEYEINPWMKRSVPSDAALARQQWHGLYQLLQSLNVTVELMPPAAGLPDLVFTANAATVIGRRAFLSWFAKLERQPEHVLYGGALRKAGFEVDTRFVEARLPFEGAGDALQLHGGELVIGWGFRTDLAAVDVLVA